MKKSPPWEYNCNAQLPLAQGGLLYYATQKRRSVEFVSHEMGLQIPHRVHAEIPEEGDLRQTPRRHRQIHQAMLHVQGRRHHRGARDARPHTHACTHTPEALRFELHGVSERQDEPDDFRRARQPQVQLRGEAFLVRGLLRQHRRAEQKDRSELHQKPRARGPDRGSSKPEGVQGPVYG